MPLQIPPAVGSSGQFVETVIVTSSQQRHVMVIGDGVSTAYAGVTSSGGLGVTLTNPSAATTAVTVTNISTAVTVTNLIRSLSSGTVTLSSNPTVVLSSPTSLSSGIVTFSSAPTVNVSSGVFTLSSNPTVVLSSPTSLSSGIVTLSSAPLVIVASSGGTIPVTLSTVFSLSSVPTVTATAATNPWSSAPGFNVPIVSASSGLIQLTSQITVTNVSASSGFVQAWHPTISAAGFGPVTSSYGLLTGTPALLSSSRLIIATSVSAISPSPGILWMVTALTTVVMSSVLGGPLFIRLYDQTTGNATSANNSGLAGACAVFRLLTSANTVSGQALMDENHKFPQGIKFATACSFDLVLTATSTAANAIGGWVTAQYTT